jgi:hypothetical protein
MSLLTARLTSAALTNTPAPQRRDERGDPAVVLTGTREVFFGFVAIPR